MANALSFEQPNVMGAFAAGEQDSYKMFAAKKEAERQGLEQLGSFAIGAMDGKIDGQADPQRWEQGLDLLEQNGADVKSLRGRPDLAPTIARGSLTTIQQLQLANDDRTYQLALQKYESDLQQALASGSKAPQVETRFNTETGQDEKVQWDGKGWVPFGGQKAPDEPLVQINNGGADEEFYKAGATARGKVFAELEAAGIEAQAKIGQVNRLEQLLDGSPQGMEGAFVQIAGEFGLQLGEGTDDVQAAQALINTMVPAQRPPGSGPMSDRDVELFKASLPRIINQPGGNELIIQTLKAIAVYEQQIGDIATQVLNKEMTPAEGKKAMAEVENPLELFRNDGGSASDVGNVPEGVEPEVWEFMTPEQRALWN